MANIFEFLSKDGNITPEKARKSRQMQFHDKTACVWGLRYWWDPSLSMNPVRRFAHFMPPWPEARNSFLSLGSRNVWWLAQRRREGDQEAWISPCQAHWAGWGWGCPPPVGALGNLAPARECSNPREQNPWLPTTSNRWNSRVIRILDALPFLALSLTNLCVHKTEIQLPSLRIGFHDL